MQSKEKQPPSGLRERAARLWALPEELTQSTPRVTMIGSRELQMENYGAILICEPEEIHVRGGKWILRIAGKGLSIRAMREHELLVTGEIDKLELL